MYIDFDTATSTGKDLQELGGNGKRETKKRAYICVSIRSAFGYKLVATEIGVVAAADIVVADGLTEVLLCGIHVFDGFQSMVVVQHFEELLKFECLQLQINHCFLHIV